MDGDELRTPRTPAIDLRRIGGCSGGTGEAGQATRFEFSCTAFPAPLSESDLVERFGAESVEEDSIVGADDGPFLGRAVNPTDPEARIEVAWRNPRRHRTGLRSSSRPRAV